MIEGFAAILASVRYRWLAFCLCTLIGISAAALLNVMSPVVYESTAKLVVAAPDWNDSTVIVDPNFGNDEALAFGDQFTQQRMATYSKLVTAALVTDDAANRLGAGLTGEQLAKMVRTRVVPDTVVLEISVRSGSAQGATDAANVVSERTADLIKALEKPSFSVVSPVQPVVVPAAVPDRPLAPRPMLFELCGAVAGLLVGATWTVVRGGRRLGTFDHSLHDRPPTVLGALTADGGNPERSQEDFRSLCLAIVAALPRKGLKRLVVTSTGTSETLTRRVAKSLADAMEGLGAATSVLEVDGRGEPEASAPLPTSSVAPVRPGPKDDVAEVDTTTFPADVARRSRFVLVVAPPVRTSVAALDMANDADATVLLCSIAERSGELRETERLLRLTGATYLGRVMLGTHRQKAATRWDL